MAFLFGDSFDHYLFADIGKKWTPSGGQDRTDLLPAYACPGQGHVVGLAFGGSSTGYLRRTIAATETFVAGVWYCSPTGTAVPVMVFLDGATEHVSVRIDATYHLTFTRNGTVLATSSNVLSSGAWAFIEVKVTIGDAGDSPSGRYEVRVNGSATGWIPDSGVGQDTRNGGNKNITVVGLQTGGSTTATTHRFQDFYVLNTSGAVANDFLGPCRFAVLRPVGVGSSAQWTGNWAENLANVNEQFADGDTTFNQDATAGHIDYFTMTDIPAGTVHALQHVLMGRDSGATRTIRPKTLISATPYSGTSFALGAAYTFHCDPVTVSPATTAQWDDAEVNAAEFGYEMVS